MLKIDATIIGVLVKGVGVPVVGSAAKVAGVVAVVVGRLLETLAGEMWYNKCNASTISYCLLVVLL